MNREILSTKLTSSGIGKEKLLHSVRYSLCVVSIDGHTVFSKPESTSDRNVACEIDNLTIATN